MLPSKVNVIGAANLQLASLREVAKPEWILHAQLVSTLLAVTAFALAEFVFAIPVSEALNVIRQLIVPEMSPTNQRQLINVVFVEEMELLALVVMVNCMEPSTITAVFVEEMEQHASILAKILLTVLLVLKIQRVDTARRPRRVSRLTPQKQIHALNHLPPIVCLFQSLF
jgi:hypothetical protein